MSTIESWLTREHLAAFGFVLSIAAGLLYVTTGQDEFNQELIWDLLELRQREVELRGRVELLKDLQYCRSPEERAEKEQRFEEREAHYERQYAEQEAFHEYCHAEKDAISTWIRWSSSGPVGQVEIDDWSVLTGQSSVSSRA